MGCSSRKQRFLTWEQERLSGPKCRQMREVTPVVSGVRRPAGHCGCGPGGVHRDCCESDGVQARIRPCGVTAYPGGPRSGGGGSALRWSRGLEEGYGAPLHMFQAAVEVEATARAMKTMGDASYTLPGVVIS